MTPKPPQPPPDVPGAAMFNRIMALFAGLIQCRVDDCESTATGQVQHGPHLVPVCNDHLIMIAAYGLRRTS